MVRRDMERDLRQYGGVSWIGPLVVVDPPEAAASPKPLLNLVCSRFDPKTKAKCDEKWQAETFTPCPKCGGKQFVQKQAVAPAAEPEPAEATEAAPNPLEEI